MRQAADGEDASIKHVAMENRLYPMRELLADLLLEAGRAKEAAGRIRARAEANAQPLSRAVWRRPRRGGDR